MIKNGHLVYIGLEVVIASLAVVGNVLVCWAVCLNSNLQSVTNLFVVSLAVADIAVGLLAIPFAIAISTGFCADFHGCLFIACFVLVLTQSSIFSLLAIAVDRYIAIKNPLRYSSVVTGQRAKTTIALCWLLSVAIGLTPMMGWNTGYLASLCSNSTFKHLMFEIINFFTGGNTANNNSCPRGLTECLFEGVVTLHYMVYFNFFGCVLMPLIAMLVIYANIFMAARHQLRLIGLKCALTRPSGEVPTISSKTILQKEIHAAKSLAIIVGLFALCWLPLHIINCFNHLCHSCERAHIWVMNIAIILSHANSVVNPLIYAYRIREFRHTFRRILSRHILGCRDRQQTDVMTSNNSVSGSRRRSSCHTSKDESSCSTVVNSYIVDSENLPPKAAQEGSNNWTTLDTMSNVMVPNGHKVNTHVSQAQQQFFLGGHSVPYEDNHGDLLRVMDNDHNITFVNVQVVMQRQTDSKQSTKLPEVS